MLPPVTEGPVKLTRILGFALPTDADAVSGPVSPGTVIVDNGIIAVDGAESSDAPLEFTASTVKVYDVSFVKPVIVA